MIFPLRCMPVHLRCMTVHLRCRYDHHSIYAFVWAWGSLVMYLVEAFIRPLMGYGLVSIGRLADAFAVAREEGLKGVGQMLGYLLKWLGLPAVRAVGAAGEWQPGEKGGMGADSAEGM